MKQKSLLVFIIVVFALSCKKDKDKKNTEVVSIDKYQNIKDNIVVFDSFAPVKVVYKDSLLGWKGYFDVQEDLELLKKTTPNEALGLSEKLVKDVALMKDSITVKTLDEKGMRARMNTLYNQALRLQEMKEIPAITVPEITKQTQGLFTLYRMINTKINAIYEQNDFEKELLEDDFFFSKLDSIE